MNNSPKYENRSLLGQKWSAAGEWLASDRLRRVRTALFQGYIILAMLGFVGLTLLAVTTPVFDPDVLLSQALQRYAPTWAGPLFYAISWPGFPVQAVVMIGAIAAFLYAVGLRWEGLVTLFVAILTASVNLLVKVAVARPRPTADLVDVFHELTSFSFPSGHVMMYTAFFGFLLFLTFTLLKRSPRRVLLIVLLLAMIALVGPSRMYLGEHWVSDVVGGYLLGSLTLILSLRLYQWGKENYVVRQSIAVTGQTETDHRPEEAEEIDSTLKNPVLPRQTLRTMEAKAPQAGQKADRKDAHARRDSE